MLEWMKDMRGGLVPVEEGEREKTKKEGDLIVRLMVRCHCLQCQRQYQRRCGGSYS